MSKKAKVQRETPRRQGPPQPPARPQADHAKLKFRPPISLRRR